MSVLSEFFGQLAGFSLYSSSSTTVTHSQYYCTAERKISHPQAMAATNNMLVIFSLTH